VFPQLQSNSNIICNGACPKLAAKTNARCIGNCVHKK
jgi:hypothetical protein